MEKLDIKSLMIADWVICHHPTQPQEIVNVSSGLLSIIERQENGIIDNSSPLYRIVKPIPITEEILKKNGFELDNEASNDFGFECYRFPLGKGFFIEHHNEYVITDHQFMKFKYVHELQHALRLCKIDKEIEL